MIAFGAPAAVIEEHKRKVALEVETTFPVLKENWLAVQLFCRLSTQFHYGAMGGATGLNYQSVEVLFNFWAVEDKKDTFDRLRIMELEALKVFNKKE